MQMYIFLAGSLLALAVGIYVLIAPRSFNKLHAHQLRGLVDYERWANPHWLLILFERIAAVYVILIASIFTWVSLSFVYRGGDSGPIHGVIGSDASRVGRLGWLDLAFEALVGTVLLVAGVTAIAWPDLFVRKLFRYALFMGEPRAEKLREWRAFARLFGTIGLIGCAMWLIRLIGQIQP